MPNSALSTSLVVQVNNNKIFYVLTISQGELQPLEKFCSRTQSEIALQLDDDHINLVETVEIEKGSNLQNFKPKDIQEIGHITIYAHKHKKTETTSILPQIKSLF